MKASHSKKVNYASRAILSSVLLFVILTLYENDFIKIFIECSQYALFLLSAHVLYVFCWKKKARMDLDTREKSFAGISLMLLIVNHPIAGFVEHNRIEFTTKWVLFSICYFLSIYLKITRNASESELLLKNTKYHIGPGLAQANYRFLENVIKGKKKDKMGGHVQLLREYMKQEDLTESSANWFCPKVLILFPEWKKENRERIWGSVSDIFKKEKENGSNHKLSNDKITYNFKASGGNNRRCELEVLKNQDERGNWYAIFAENRPLNTLYRMVGEPVIPFSEEDFNRQFHIYMNDLRKLLDDDEGCRGKYEIFHYKDSGRLNFSKEIISQMKRIRNEPNDQQDSTSEIQNGVKCQEDETKDKIETDSTNDMENVLHIRKAIHEVEPENQGNVGEDKKNV